MIPTKKEIEGIYSDCRALLLLQDEDSPDVLIETLTSEFAILSDQNLDKIAAAVGFRDTARFLKASDYFNVFKKDNLNFVRLADPKTKDKGKKKVPAGIPVQRCRTSAKAPKTVDPVKKVPKPQPLKEKVTQHDQVEAMDVDPIQDDNNNKNKNQKMHESSSKCPPTDPVITIDDNEVSYVPQPQFIVQMTDDPRYEAVLREHERSTSKDPQEFVNKDLRYLINARKAYAQKSWKNDMFYELYPGEIDNQERLLAEKYRQSLIRKCQLQE